ncbi:hypothetical protein PG996_005539 [Apiospora saccharicola]|uniref:Rhodopsin domain-containing protein n=1 Tax=Apiospora saccharicola TaxID=335842 RepID=A0ABR1VLR6_9PEZI
MAATADTADDRSPLIQALTWFLLLAGFFSICARIVTKYFLRRVMEWDDKLMLAAEASLIGQAVAVSISASRGLGKSIYSLSDETVDGVLQADYAGTPLFLLSLTLIKWSLSAFVRQLSPNKDIEYRVDQGLSFIVGLWFLSAAVVGLFQCRLPKPWDYIQSHNCIDRRSWWTYVASLNIITEVGYVLVYALVFRRIQVSRRRRFTLQAIFSTRLFPHKRLSTHNTGTDNQGCRVVIPAVIQLRVFKSSYPSHDLTYDLWLPTVCNQIVACFSVVTACVPYLRPFMESIEPDNVVQIDDEETSGSRGTTERRLALRELTTAPTDHCHSSGAATGSS